jgi:diaminopimelate epimerase
MRFYKMTGSGNDFVFLDGRETAESEWPQERIRQICRRRQGVGADGLVLLRPAGDAVEMIFFNSDGSRAAMCGNAALCSTQLAVRLGMAEPAGMRLATQAGTFRTRCAGSAWEAEINLPGFRAPGRPDLDLDPGERLCAVGTVGVPHVVLQVDDIERPGLMDRGRFLRSHEVAGPDGANVNFVAPGESGEPWPLRTFERGVEGETLACGTGTVAVAAALADAGLVTLPQEFVSRGGQILTVSGRREGPGWVDVWLRGEGRLVYQGDF